MKPTTRRLGRGLGAFLDFGPSGADGAAFVPDAIRADATSILETSVAPPARALAPVVVRQPAPAPAPVSPPAPVAAPASPRIADVPPPELDDSVFIDVYIDDVVAPLPVAAPAPAPVVVPAPAATRIAPAPPPEPPPAADDNVFIDDVVAPLSFGDVDLE
jgi:hypothetical protein